MLSITNCLLWKNYYIVKMYIFFQIIKYFCFQFESGPGPMPIWWWLTERLDQCLTWHTGDVSLIPNFINKTTLDKSWITLVYENLFKTFCCCLNYTLSLSLYTSLSLSLSHDVDFCEVIKNPGGRCYVIFCFFNAFRPMKLGIRLTSPVCHVTHLSAAWSIIITYMLLPERSFERRLFRDLFNQVFWSPSFRKHISYEGHPFFENV